MLKRIFVVLLALTFITACANTGNNDNQNPAPDEAPMNDNIEQNNNDLIPNDGDLNRNQMNDDRMNDNQLGPNDNQNNNHDDGLLNNNNTNNNNNR